MPKLFRPTKRVVVEGTKPSKSNLHLKTKPFLACFALEKPDTGRFSAARLKEAPESYL